MSYEPFRRVVWKYWKDNGRHDLPWRKTKDPYKILISEVMLQQTQVPRVIEKYKEFLAAFPTVDALAQAPLSDVLRVWSGMGYNRRGKFLKDAAEVIVEKYRGKVPRDLAALQSLPGVGPYTAGAVRAFAFNEPGVLIETNIRSAFIHAFFTPNQVIHSNYRGPTSAYRGPTSVVLVTDAALLPLIAKAGEGQNPREWYWALMDYGAYVKKLHKNPSRASASYSKQSKFEGSLRQIRGAILRELQGNPQQETELQKSLSRSGLGSYPQLLSRPDLGEFAHRMKQALTGLERDGMIEKRKGKWRIA